MQDYVKKKKNKIRTFQIFKKQNKTKLFFISEIKKREEKAA